MSDLSTMREIEAQEQALLMRQDREEFDPEDDYDESADLDMKKETEMGSIGERLARARGWEPHFGEVSERTTWQDERGHWHDTPDPENSPEDFWRFLEWAVDKCDVMGILRDAAETRVLADLRCAVTEAILEVVEND